MNIYKDIYLYFYLNQKWLYFSCWKNMLGECRGGFAVKEGENCYICHVYWSSI